LIFSSHKEFRGKLGTQNAQKELIHKLKQIEDALKTNNPENKFLFNSKEFSFADALVSPYLVRLYVAIKQGHSVLEKISMEIYPHVNSYCEMLINDDKLAPAYNLDEPVEKSKSAKSNSTHWSKYIF
jgi:glutathione S-transferase